MIAEGSVSGVLDGHRYNHAVRFHKLMYEALQDLLAAKAVGEKTYQIFRVE